MTTNLTQLGIRDRAALADARRRAGSATALAAAALDAAVSSGGVEAATVLSTCERLEVYVISRDGSGATASIASLASASTFGIERRVGAAATEHLFSIAAGLESRLVGEPHVLGQVSQMPVRGTDAGSRVLQRLKQDAVGAARRIRQSTGLERIGVSCVDLAVARVHAAGGGAIAIVGSGAISRELMHRLDGQRPLVLVARHPERLVAQGVTQVATLAQLSAVVNGVSVLIAATSAVEPIVRQEHIAERLRSTRGEQPLLVIDLGMPCNCDVERDSAGLTLVTLDDLTAGREQPSEVLREARVRAQSRAARWAARWLGAPKSGSFREGASRSLVA